MRVELSHLLIEKPHLRGAASIKVWELFLSVDFASSPEAVLVRNLIGSAGHWASRFEFGTGILEIPMLLSLIRGLSYGVTGISKRDADSLAPYILNLLAGPRFDYMNELHSPYPLKRLLAMYALRGQEVTA
jgi:hypothetical protein